MNEETHTLISEIRKHRIGKLLASQSRKNTNISTQSKIIFHIAPEDAAELSKAFTEGHTHN